MVQVPSCAKLTSTSVATGKTRTDGEDDRDDRREHARLAARDACASAWRAFHRRGRKLSRAFVALKEDQRAERNDREDHRFSDGQTSVAALPRGVDLECQHAHVAAKNSGALNEAIEVMNVSNAAAISDGVSCGNNTRLSTASARRPKLRALQRDSRRFGANRRRSARRKTDTSCKCETAARRASRAAPGRSLRVRRDSECRGPEFLTRRREK